MCDAEGKGRVGEDTEEEDGRRSREASQQIFGVQGRRISRMHKVSAYVAFVFSDGSSHSRLFAPLRTELLNPAFPAIEFAPIPSLTICNAYEQFIPYYNQFTKALFTNFLFRTVEYTVKAYVLNA